MARRGNVWRRCGLGIVLAAAWIGAAPLGAQEKEAAVEEVRTDIQFAHPNRAPNADLLILDCGPSGRLDLCALDLTTGSLRKLTTTPDLGEAVGAFSRDGTRVSFSRERAGRWYLAVLDLESGEVAELVDLHQTHASASTWTLGDERILFGRKGEEGDYDIVSTLPDGSDLQLVVGGPGMQRYPALSPDGRRLAYAEIEDGKGDVWIAEADGSNPRKVIAHEADDGLPMWSADGAALSFYSQRDGNIEVYLTDLEGTERRLTNHPAFDIFAPFSLDGRSVVFESTRDRDPTSFEQGADLYRLDLESGEIERLTVPGDWVGLVSAEK